jgi:hypothetical protein
MRRLALRDRAVPLDHRRGALQSRGRAKFGCGRVQLAD